MTNWSAITWQSARAAGLVSYVLLTVTVSAGLLLGSRWQSKRWPRRITNEVHGYLSLLALVFITIHVLAVAIDPFTHFGLVAVLVPFVSAYRPIWMGLGIVGLYLLLAVWASTKLRTRIGHRLWRRIHFLAFAIYAFATLHGLGAGTDTRTPWALAIYAVSVTIVGLLVGVRLLAPAAAGPRQRPLAAALAGAALIATAGWTVAGPLDAHWGKRPVPSLAAAPARRSRPVASTALAAAVVTPPFVARFTGALIVEPVDRAGRVTVRIDGALTGATHDHLEILLHGRPLESGGVLLEESRVRMGTRRALYHGGITALHGTRLIAVVRSPRQRVRLSIELRVGDHGRVLGTVRGTGSSPSGGTA